MNVIFCALNPAHHGKLVLCISAIYEKQKSVYCHTSKIRLSVKSTWVSVSGLVLYMSNGDDGIKEFNLKIKSYKKRYCFEIKSCYV